MEWDIVRSLVAMLITGGTGAIAATVMWSIYTDGWIRKYNDLERQYEELDGKSSQERESLVKVNKDLAEENTQLRAKLEDTEKALDINDKACSANFVKFMEAKKQIRSSVDHLRFMAETLNGFLLSTDKAPENAPEPNGD
jgi:predicted nuclease with TOPRIM domain